MTDNQRLPPILLTNLKDQLIISLMKRCMNENGILKVPVSEIDDTGQDYMIMECDHDNREFILTLGKKS